MNQIKWKKGDYIKLGKAIAEFNKKIKNLENINDSLYLPDLENYNNKKQEIQTRAELNRFINSLKRFKRDGAEELYTTNSGIEMTTWERRELGIMSRTAQNKLNKELKVLNLPNEQGFSRAQMGSTRVAEINHQIKILKDLENRDKEQLKRLKKTLFNLSSTDAKWKKAKIYQENYLNEMEKYQNFDGYENLMNRLKDIKNPIKFYNFVGQTELTKDLTYQSDQQYSQNEFNRFLETLGIENNDIM